MSSDDNSGDYPNDREANRTVSVFKNLKEFATKNWISKSASVMCAVLLIGLGGLATNQIASSDSTAEDVEADGEITTASDRGITGEAVAPANGFPLSSFSDRAEMWADARRFNREQAVDYAQELAELNRNTTTSTIPSSLAVSPNSSDDTVTTIIDANNNEEADNYEDLNIDDTDNDAINSVVVSDDSSNEDIAVVEVTATTTTTVAPLPANPEPPPTSVAAFASHTEAPSPTTTTTATVETVSRSQVGHPLPAGTTAEQWDALRFCESTHNYQAVSSTGRYRGAYQFSVRTWNWVAGMHYEDLVGVDPKDASPSDQDKMAYKLYEIYGWDPWPTCKKRLPS